MVAVAFFRTAYGVSTKVGLLEGAKINKMLLIFSSSWIVGGAIYALRSERRFRITWEKARFIFLSSLFVVGIVNFLMLAVLH